jgi:hypothetical protein
MSTYKTEKLNVPVELIVSDDHGTLHVMADEYSASTYPAHLKTRRRNCAHWLNKRLKKRC